MVKVNLSGERMVLAASVVSALDRFDLALLLWAVQSWPRTRVLGALLKETLTARDLVRRTGVKETSVYRALKELQGTRLVTSRRMIPGVSGRIPKLYSIALTGLEPEEREI
jgi:DNA-binding transcriptional ArsR family regulator